MRQVAVFHPGTQHSWQTARALQDLDRLSWYATSIFYQPERWPYRLERLPGAIGRSLRREFSRFEARGIDPANVRTSGNIEWLERVARRAGQERLATWLDRRGNAAFGRGLARAIASDDRFMLWGFDSSSRTAFEAGKRQGRRLILDRTIGDRRALNRVMLELRETWSDWFNTTTRDLIPAVVIDDEEHEYALADVILTGSQSAADTVRAESRVPGCATKLRVLPYCYDEALFGDQAAGQLSAQTTAPTAAQGRSVRFLFIGQLGTRKGLHLLLNAIARLPRSEATLTLVGSFTAPAKAIAPFLDRVEHIAHVPRAAIPAIMARHDVLVLPSYFEGSSLVLLEALASGMAIIQSHAAGCGATPTCGIILDTLSVDALETAMRVPIEDRVLLAHWRAGAREEAARYTFASYRDRIASLLHDLDADSN